MQSRQRSGHLLITQTPCSLAPHLLSARQRRFVGFGSDFQTRLVQEAINLAEKLGIDSVLGYSVLSHPSILDKVSRGELTTEKAYSVLDGLYERLGFIRGDDNMYYKFLDL